MRYGYDYDNYGYDDEEDGWHPALKWGMTFGIIQAVLSVIPFILIVLYFPLAANRIGLAIQEIFAQQDFGSAAVVVIVIDVCSFASLVTMFLVGYFTARETGTLKSGAGAGVLATLASTTITVLVEVVWLAMQPRLFVANSPVAQAAALVGGFSGQCCSLIFVFLFAALCGMLGALPGRRAYERA